MFKSVFGALRVFREDDKAVMAIEYALIAALNAVVMIGAASTLGGDVGTTFNHVASEL